MTDFSQITIVSIYGNNDGASAIPALSHSMEQMPGARGLLLSVEKPLNLMPSIQWKRIYPLDYGQYSLFVMHMLYSHIETEYTIIVQDDGWIINGGSWKDEYFNYDYIGAPCHAAYIGGELICNYRWANSYRSKGFIDGHVIQNGGFSLRSRRFLRVLNEIGLAFQLNPAQNEDVFVTGIHKATLASHGIKFAKDDLAKNFSVEYMDPIIHSNYDFSKLFGIHGQTRKLIDHNVVICKDPKDLINQIYGERQILAHLASLGYEIRYPE